MMYFVDRTQIEKALKNMEKLLDVFEARKKWDGEFCELALERLVHVLIESFLDVGNQMIDGFIMRDPGSYEDIVDILVDESVVPKKSEEGFKAVVHLRKQLVRDYVEVNHDEVLSELTNFLNVWRAFPAQVREYLEKELGPVSAFKSNNE